MVHDWGGLIGLRWACDHPDAVRALAISDSGFFPDGQWHGMAQTMRTEGEGEQFMDNVSRELLGTALAQLSAGMTEEDHDACWKCLSTPDRRAAVLEMYRSGDFEKLEPYQGKLAALGVPTKIIWGEEDEFAPVAGAHRLAGEIPGAEVVVIEGARHFVVEDATERYCEELVAFACVADRLTAWTSCSRRSPSRPPARRPCAPPTSRWPPGCARPRWRSTWARTTCWSPARRCAPRWTRAARTR